MSSGRIPDSFIQDLLTRIDIVEIIGKRVELKRAGRSYKGLSPFSNEKSPSFFVSPDKQLFNDFSSGKGGSVIQFLMEYDRLSFADAIEELAQHAGLEVPREGRFNSQLVLEGPLDALAAAARYFQDQYKRHERASSYAVQRGLNSETLKTFGIGYAPESWDGLSRLFPNPKHALEAGMLIARDSGGVYDRFRNRLMFPIKDGRGRVIGFGGRTLADDPAKYLNSPETPLFHKSRNLYGVYEAKQANKSDIPYLLVVEGYMDVVMTHQHGIPNVVATLGTATTAEHLTLLFKLTNTVVFCFDGDRAGRAAAWRALEQALPVMQGTRECRFLFLPDGQDPDTFVQTFGAEALRSQISSAQALTEFLLAELCKQTDLNTLDGRAKLAALAKPYLDQLQEGPLRELLNDELARRTRMRAESVEKLSKSPRSARSTPATTRHVAPLATDPATRMPRRALRLLLECPHLAQTVNHTGQLAMLGSASGDALLQGIEYFQDNPHHNAAHLLHHWGDGQTRKAVERLLAEPLVLDDRALAAEFAEAILKLRLSAVRAQWDALLARSNQNKLSEAETRELQALEVQLKTLRGK